VLVDPFWFARDICSNSKKNGIRNRRIPVSGRQTANLLKGRMKDRVSKNQRGSNHKRWQKILTKQVNKLSLPYCLAQSLTVVDIHQTQKNAAEFIWQCLTDYRHTALD